MPIHLPRRRLLAVGAAASLLRHAAADTPPRRGGTLVVALASEPGDLFAPSVYSQATVVPGGKLFDTLLRWRLDDTFAPRLAESWQAAADGKSFSFRLREGVRFHDGHPLTVEDVVFTVNELWRKTHALNRVVLADLAAIETPDARTITFRMATPTPAFPLLGTLSAFGQIAPKHIYGSGELRRNPAINAPVGTGPYRMQDWDRGNTILMQRNQDYWDKSLPYLEQIQFQIMPDPQARSAALETGEVHAGIYSPLPASDQKRLEAMETLVFDRAGNRSTAGTFVSELNLRRKELADVRVR
jgi:peptide/nickel transport system substrate-binding protein